MSAAPVEVLAPRRKSHKIKIGSIHVGGGTPISVQPMTNTKATDINGILQQVAKLTAAGCDTVKVAVPSADDAEALPIIVMKSQTPMIADIHFQPRHAFAAIDVGCTAVHVNSGNTKQFDDKIAEIAKAATDAGVSLRIGVNAGSLDKRLLAKYGVPMPEALVESAVWKASLFEQVGLYDFKISVKHHDPVVMVRAYELLAEACEHPLHLGVTEAGPVFQGIIKSPVAFGALPSEGIGGTIRVSLSVPPTEEVKVGTKILEPLNLRSRKLDIASYPSCGRAQVDACAPTEEVTKGLEGMKAPLRAAVMGCAMDGPDETHEADLGVASGSGKGKIFIHDEIIKTAPEGRIMEALLAEAHRIVAEMSEMDELQVPAL